jgi:hypothetical protein
VVGGGGVNKHSIEGHSLLLKEYFRFVFWLCLVMCLGLVVMLLVVRLILVAGLVFVMWLVGFQFVVRLRLWFIMWFDLRIGRDGVGLGLGDNRGFWGSILLLAGIGGHHWGQGSAVLVLLGLAVSLGGAAFVHHCRRGAVLKGLSLKGLEGLHGAGVAGDGRSLRGPILIRFLRIRRLLVGRL